MSRHESASENDPIPTRWSRGEIVFAAAALALAMGVFAPVPELGLDILWVCVLSLTLAVGVIFPAAASTADLKGFAALLSVPALLRITLVAAVCIRLFSAEPVGLLIPTTGRLLTRVWPLGAALICLAAASLLTVALFTACQRIAVAAERYKSRIFPLKCVGIRTDVKTGIITPPQARQLADKIQAESRLFSNLTGAAMLMRIEGALAITAMLACLMYPFFSNPAGNAAEQITRAAAAAAGLTAFSLVPAAIAALAGAHLTGKDSLTLRPAAEPCTNSRTFMLVDQETGLSEEIELLNPDFVGHGEHARNGAAAEHIAEFEPPPAPLIETLPLTADAPQTYYRQLARHVIEAAFASPTVLFTAQTDSRLPVTVFVNTAIRLVQDGRRVLLVDADTRRNALAQVFDMNAARLNASIQPTAFEGLSLCGVDDNPNRTAATLQDAARHYACVLIYAPDNTFFSIAVSALKPLSPAAFVFGPANPDQTRRITETLHGCRQLYFVTSLPA